MTAKLSCCLVCVTCWICTWVILVGETLVRPLSHDIEERSVDVVMMWYWCCVSWRWDDVVLMLCVVSECVCDDLPDQLVHSSDWHGSPDVRHCRHHSSVSDTAAANCIWTSLVVVWWALRAAVIEAVSTCRRTINIINVAVTSISVAQWKSCSEKLRWKGF